MQDLIEDFFEAYIALIEHYDCKDKGKFIRERAFLQSSDNGQVKINKNFVVASINPIHLKKIKNAAGTELEGVNNNQIRRKITEIEKYLFIRDDNTQNERKTITVHNAFDVQLVKNIIGDRTRFDEPREEKETTVIDSAKGIESTVNIYKTSSKDVNKDRTIDINIIQPVGELGPIKADMEEKLKLLDAETVDLLNILTDIRINRLDDNVNSTKEFNVYYKDIHFNYRKLTGKDKYRLTDEQIESYVNRFKLLSDIKIRLELKGDSRIYSKIDKELSRNGVKFVEDRIINIKSDFLDIRETPDGKRTVIKGHTCEFGKVFEYYINCMKSYNNYYSKSLLSLRYDDYGQAKRVGDYLCYINTIKVKQKQIPYLLGLETIMDRVNASTAYEAAREKQKFINRFLRQLEIAIGCLVADGILDHKTTEEFQKLKPGIKTRNLKAKDVIFYPVTKDEKPRKKP
jgi:hypothetical protein